MLVEELTLSHSEVVERRSTGKAIRAQEQLSGHPATRRILVSLYDKNWRTGPIGARLRDHAIDPG